MGLSKQKCVVLSLMSAIGLLGSTSALAACTNNATPQTIAFPPNLTIPRDANIGTPLSTWATSASATDWFKCIVVPATSSASGVSFRANSATTGLSTSVEGSSYPIFPTGVEGIGVILSFRGYYNGCAWVEPWRPIDSSINWKGNACNSSGAVTNGGQMRAMLVKTGKITAGLIPPTSVATAVAQFKDGSAPYVQDMSTAVTFNLAPVNVNILGCKTPDVQVRLGDHKSSLFKGIGSTSPTESFSIALNDCPAGLGAIQYRLDPILGVADPTNSVIEILPGAKGATGIGVQLMDDVGKALPLGQMLPFTQYSASTGGNYEIPLKARYRQFAANMTPGNARAVMTFTINYQ